MYRSNICNWNPRSGRKRGYGQNPSLRRQWLEILQIGKSHGGAAVSRSVLTPIEMNKEKIIVRYMTVVLLKTEDKENLKNTHTNALPPKRKQLHS